LKRELKVLLDTNVLILSIKYGLDIFSYVEEALLRKCSFYILDRTLSELENISTKGKSLDKRAAIKALEMVKERCKVLQVKALPGETVDDIIVRVVHENKMIIITNDRELRSRIRALGMPVGWINLKEKRVKIEGYYD